MLYALFQKLTQFQSSFNALSYLSSRAILSLLTAIFISMVLYPPLIKWLRALKLGQPIRELGPASHMEKKGTPTMGGVVIIFATVASALLWMDLGNRHLWTLVIVSLGFGIVGFLDDYLKISKKNPQGLASRWKMLGLVGFGVLAIAWHLWSAANLVPKIPWYSVSTLNIPFVKDWVVNLSYLYAPFALLVVTGSSNAVNLTDGLDGLAIGPVITCSIALLVLSYVTGNVVVAKYLYYHTVHGSGEITVFLAGLIGASLGFLWYNTWPAQVFMGDSGALPLGGIIGAVAVITGHEILLIIMGGVFVVEALSVIIQVGSFKIRQKRVFRMAPLHHHFEKGGWPEQKITIRAWILSFMLALFSILTLKLR
ncbi:MAG: phospho-N-acetylmuramoyl-pentapeptide-transferase [Silvanigrellales bacterium]|jgi:phospho-N-acetylmuramoyl-pentapeptide-transferase|nr:phospho-N-acetylmuramoyl-pentapeptide-transferase [Silvanigrellales bacterium]